MHVLIYMHLPASSPLPESRKQHIVGDILLLWLLLLFLLLFHLLVLLLLLQAPQGQCWQDVSHSAVHIPRRAHLALLLGSSLLLLGFFLHRGGCGALVLALILPLALAVLLKGFTRHMGVPVGGSVGSVKWGEETGCQRKASACSCTAPLPPSPAPLLLLLRCCLAGLLPCSAPPPLLPRMLTSLLPVSSPACGMLTSRGAGPGRC